ncbi:MAG TPA: response regulator [Deltaproteobacteria bacterium]|nr:response regulator [Deltaproteobacteria bacterium]
MKILSVDDNAANLYLMESMLRGSGYEVVSVHNGVEALQELERQPFDLIISDILMPQMDGFQLCHEVKNREALRNIPFIFYTATYTDKKDEDFALSLGASRFIVKPAEPEKFMETIAAVLDEHARGVLRIPEPASSGEVYLKAYNESLIHKLEQKLEQLEEVNRKLQAALREKDREIDLRQRSEDALRVSEARYRQLYDSMMDGFVGTDMDGSIREYNEAYLRMLDCVPADVEGLRYMDLTPERWHGFEAEIIEKQVVSRGYSDIYEKEYQRKDGTVFPVELRSYLIRDDGGNPVGLWAIVRDITERKRAEEERKRLEAQLTQAQKMESIGTLAGGIAHDFNNILSFIIGYTELALDDDSVPDKVRDDLKGILRAGDRAKELVSQILTFCRKTDNSYSPLAIGTVVKESLKMLRSAIPSTIEIRQDIMDLGLVLTDLTQIHQIMMNLCTNAAHAMEENGGVLSVSLKKVYVDGEMSRRVPELPMGPYVTLAVSDTGHGMTSEVQERIFEPYFTTKEQGRGTGLGLSVVHGIVKNHEGAITCTSEPGRGTTFTVYLPMVDAVKDMKESHDERPLQTGTERILVIDDEPDLVNLARMMLGRLGYEVITKTSCAEALEVFGDDPGRFDLVITDMTMPGLTGDKVAQRLMSIRHDIPIILCTGYSEHMTKELARSIGIREFLLKPIEMGELAKTVRKVLDER